MADTSWALKKNYFQKSIDYKTHYHQAVLVINFSRKLQSSTKVGKSSRGIRFWKRLHFESDAQKNFTGGRSKANTWK